MALTGLREKALKLILFGGKGGVGKTTCASSTALYLAKDFKTLLISTDPAHSLSDSFGQQIGDEINALSNGSAGNLCALEIHAEKALSEFKMRYKSEIKKLLDTSTYLDEEDIEAIIALPIPGIDEVMGFKTILDLIEEGRFDKYIVDTAPTGHALRLLTLPELLDDWIKVMAKMRWKYRYMVQSFSGKYRPDEADDFLLTMKKTVKKIEILLRDSQRCEFIVVTTPEDMVVSETERLITHLKNYGIKVKQLIINNVIESRACEFCKERREEQEKYINYLKREFADLRMVTVPLQPRGIKGIEALKVFMNLLFVKDEARSLRDIFVSR